MKEGISSIQRNRKRTPYLDFGLWLSDSVSPHPQTPSPVLPPTVPSKFRLIALSTTNATQRPHQRRHVSTPIPTPTPMLNPFGWTNTAAAAAAPNLKAVVAQENATASSLARRRDVLAVSWEGVYLAERVRIEDMAAALRHCLLGACGKLQELVEESWRERLGTADYWKDEVRIPFMTPCYILPHSVVRPSGVRHLRTASIRSSYSCGRVSTFRPLLLYKVGVHQSGSPRLQRYKVIVSRL